MKFRNLNYFLLLLLFSLTANGQINPTPEENRRIEQHQRQQERTRQEQATSRLKHISARRPIIGRTGKRDGSFYGKLPKVSAKDRQAVAIATDIMATYDEFLKQDKTGIIRLYDANTCSEEKHLINANESCPDAYPGKATAFSFRTEKYQWKGFSDIFIENSKVHIKGLHLLGILSSLGDKSLDDLTLASDGVKQLYELEPPNKMEDFEKYSKIIGKGVQIENQVFSSEAQLKSGQTYMLRAIAFGGSFVSRYPKSSGRLIWGEDKRDDIIVIFKAVRKNEDQSWIILWKELMRKSAPKINF
jgi:hypothetical protein